MIKDKKREEICWPCSFGWHLAAPHQDSCPCCRQKHRPPMGRPKPI